ncbi:MAG: class I SAM-dependent methyltransferase [Micrococcales bacterium]|nr:class I SAM-dependent methyltransferase [Micrococcales bacterium]
MDANAWDERYAATEMVWSKTPNQFVAELVGPLTPGRVLDVAAGEGRNAIWLAEQGWTVVATDYSRVAIERLRQIADERLGDRASGLTAHVADATQPAPGGEAAYDLVLFSYLQLPDDDWLAALRSGIAATAPGGRIVIIVHAQRNLTEGYGGPSDPAVLHDPDDIIEGVAGLPVEVESAELRTRLVATEDGERAALDTVAVLRRIS